MDGSTPLYLRIQATLRSALLSGEFPPGRPLPGEPTLAERFGAARMTVRKAVAGLAAEGLVRREAGRGTWPNVPGNLAGLRADMGRLAETSTVTLVRCARVPAIELAGIELPMPIEEDAYHVVRSRRDDVGPFSFVESWVPTGLAPDGLDEEALRAGRPLLEQLGGVGAALPRVRQRISAAAAGPEAALALDIPIGSPLTRLDRVVQRGDGGIAEISRSLYRPDRFAYAVDLADGALASPPRWESSER